MTATDTSRPIRAVDEEGGASPGLDPSERSFWIGLVVVVLSLISALATYLILTGLTSIVPRDEVVLGVLFTNVVMILAMIGVIAWQVAGLARSWRQKLAGARLHVRIVGLFSIIAALPAIVLAVAATVTFSRSLDGWFSTRTRAIIDNSLNVAQAYVKEHGQLIRTDVVNMARDLDASQPLPDLDSLDLRQLVIAQAGLRDLPAAYIIDRSGKPILSAIEDDKLPYLPPSEVALRQAEADQVPILAPQGGNRIAALAKLRSYPGNFLYVARGISPRVLGHLRVTEQNVDEYQRLRRARSGLKLAHGLMYLTISMTALLAAIWVGMWFAGRFVAPIRRLIAAAQQVSKGNLRVELPERRGEGDLRRLSQTFNTMTRELKTQRDALVTANEQLLERRRFMEAVLAGVSAGVLGLDARNRITLANRSAQRLLGATAPELVGKKLDQAVPAFAALLAQDHGLKKQRAPEQVTLEVGGEERTFSVRFTRERAGKDEVGSVVTFDDITDLVSAQRTSAWADVARRIAHEIKNPLTPIILSAERIRRRYGKVITEDRETFDNLTATIERQAGDIKSMVDEFASFARMPKPQMEEVDLRLGVKEPMILFRESHPAIVYTLTLPEQPVIGMFDRRLITQAVTNLVKNATEAVETVAESADKEPDWKGQVEARLATAGDRVTIEVIDNGVGLPKHNRGRLLEPYVTTKGQKGTGLGLAMVQKITEQHGGTLELEDAPQAPGRTRGALVRMTLPLSRQTPSATPERTALAAGTTGGGAT